MENNSGNTQHQPLTSKYVPTTVSAHIQTSAIHGLMMMVIKKEEGRLTHIPLALNMRV